MNFVSKTVEDPAAGAVVLDGVEGFHTLLKPDVAAAVWHRQLPAEFQKWIGELPVEKLPSARIALRIDSVRDAVEVVCDSAGIADTLNRRLLVNDVVMLCENFATLMNVDLIRLRFDVVHGDACRKFHVDAVTARLVCTYRGPGTQYGFSADGNEPARISSAQTGSPILLRGTLWPEVPASGLLHRSPPIEGTGKTRLVLVIDPVSSSA